MIRLLNKYRTDTQVRQELQSCDVTEVDILAISQTRHDKPSLKCNMLYSLSRHEECLHAAPKALQLFCGIQMQYAVLGGVSRLAR